MEKEYFFTGYCRQLDSSRTVGVCICDGEVAEADCAYHSCVYAPGCQIGKQIKEESDA